MLAAAFPPYAVATFLCLLLAGRLIDRFSALALLPVYLEPFGLACLILGGVSAPWAAFAFMLLYGITDGISLTLFGALWPEVYGTRHLGAIRGAIVAIMVLGTALGPFLSGCSSMPACRSPGSSSGWASTASPSPVPCSWSGAA